MLTLADLGVLRDVDEDGRQVVVTITPTYSGCPAMATMRDDLVHALQRRRVRATSRCGSASPPAWSTDWITERGRRALARARHLRARAGAAARRPGRAPR